MTDENKYDDLFEKKEEVKKEKQRMPLPSYSKLKKGIVANINKVKGTITIDYKGNGEQIDYIEERHSTLKIGDAIEF